MPIGTIFSHVSSNPPAGAVLLSGQTLAQSDYTEFYNYIINDKDNIRVISNDDYEDEIKQYGFCGAFVINENEVRLPNYKNAFLMGGNSTNNGTAVEAGLPNITGKWTEINHYGRVSTEGALSHTYSHESAGTTDGGDYGNRGPIYFYFSAANSNPIYGNSDTVQPPAICVNYYIQVYNSTYTPNNVEAALKDLSNVDSKFDFVIECSQDDETGSWYRKYRSGWVEQGGIYESANDDFFQESHTITLPVPLTKLYDSKFTLVYGNKINGTINFYLNSLPTDAIIKTIDMWADSSQEHYYGR